MRRYQYCIEYGHDQLDGQQPSGIFQCTGMDFFLR